MIGRIALTSLIATATLGRVARAGTTAGVAVLVLASGVAAIPAQANAQADAAQAGGVTSFGDAPGVVRLPEAVAVAPGGDLLVGDHFSGRVQRFRDGRYVGSFGLRGEGCGRLGAIGGLAVDGQGNTYVLDSDQQLVQVFDANGASVRCFGGNGSGRGQFRTGSGGYAASSASGGIAVSGDAVYVADTGNNRVQRFTLTGQNPKVIGKGKLDTPQGLAVKGSRLLVADDGHHRVVELTTSGRYVRDSKGVDMSFPYDVAFDANGGAYVADNSYHRIIQLDRKLQRKRAWGSQGGGHGKFVYPRAVAVLGNGNLVVADAGNDRVQQFTATGGYVRTIGINGRKQPYVSSPADVAANGLGEVAVADGNGRISWFSLDGRFAGAWAQSRSFQNSTAIVVQPNAIDFASDRAVQVVDVGDVREYRDGAVDRIFTPGFGQAGATSFDIGPDGAQWAVQGTGTFARIVKDTKPTWLGERNLTGRSTAAIAALADGTIAVTEGTSPHQVKPKDGTIIRYDHTGKRLSAWTVPRPVSAGAHPSRPAGLVAIPGGGAWVSDAANDRLLRFTADGTIAETLGAPGTGDGQLAEPRGLDLDCAGGLLVADSGNNRIVRFADAGAATGCAPAGTPTAKGQTPKPVGLKVKTERRSDAPATTLGTIKATCARTCTLAVQEASVGVLGRGTAKSYKLTAIRDGSVITVKAAAATVEAMRSAVRAGGSVGAGIVVVATAKDGVEDIGTITWTFR
ncbi:NHL repeat-containing protein [Baekduia sp. Peel2402]|uniref:NHL repeat-containing protein n=1 Tax=Baekduia sp. Peel2402 TaxID=3458296 RepID=UPI00403EB4DD